MPKSDEPYQYVQQGMSGHEKRTFHPYYGSSGLFLSPKHRVSLGESKEQFLKENPLYIDPELAPQSRQKRKEYSKNGGLRERRYEFKVYDGYVLEEYQIVCGPRLCGDINCKHGKIRWGGTILPPTWSSEAHNFGWSSVYGNPFRLDFPESHFEKHTLPYIHVQDGGEGTMVQNPNFTGWEGMYATHFQDATASEEVEMEDLSVDPEELEGLEDPIVPEGSKEAES